MSAATDSITLFDRINLARCAMERANYHLLDEQRFTSEYYTARSWTKYKCIISSTYQLVDYL